MIPLWRFLLRVSCLPCVRYQIAVGTSPGGGQIQSFIPIPLNSKHYTVGGLNLNGERQVTTLFPLVLIFNVSSRTNVFDIHFYVFLKLIK